MSRTRAESIADIVDSFLAGRKFRHNSIFAEGDKLYSYGHHYVAAKKHGFGVYLINSTSYSVTTALHTSNIAYSLGNRGFTTVHVPDCKVENFGNNRRLWLRETKKRLQKCQKRAVVDIWDELILTAKQYQDEAEKLSLPAPFVMSPEEFARRFVRNQPKVKEKLILRRMNV